MSAAQSAFVVTGNLTEEGCVAYLRQDDSWATSLAEAHGFDTKEAAEAKLAEVKPAESVITEPYVFEAERAGATLVPTSARERLRAGGPSTRLRRPDATAS